jgi:GntR family transcriptional regulator / MocR family aminotransferase
MELHLDGVGSLQRQIYSALRQRMESGVLAGGSRLPGSRLLARDLGVSRGTVVAAYEQLVAEGYCNARGRAATRVAQTLPRVRAHEGRRLPPAVPHAIRWRAGDDAFLFDLRSGLPNPADFPHAIWARLLRAKLKQHATAAFDYPHPEGLPQLRQAVASHLQQWRGLPCGPDRVLITHGSQQAFSLIARALLPAGLAVAVEDPGYHGFSQAVRAAGVAVRPVAVDDAGIMVDDIRHGDLSAVYVTPAHQFPTGVLMSAPRRRALLDWAENAGSWIIEDDYDSAYRFDAPPLAPLKQYDDTGRVLLVGSFSKTVFPDLRLGYVVAEPATIEVLSLLKNLDDAGSSGLYQAALAAFLDQGHYQRHLRRSLRHLARRRGALIDAVVEHFGDRARLLGAQSGLHIVVDVGLTAVQERELVRTARSHGLGLHALGAFSQSGMLRPGLLLGFGRLEEGSLQRAVALLHRLVLDVQRRDAGGRRET